MRIYMKIYSNTDDSDVIFILFDDEYEDDEE